MAYAFLISLVFSPLQSSLSPPVFAVSCILLFNYFPPPFDGGSAALSTVRTPRSKNPLWFRRHLWFSSPKSLFYFYFYLKINLLNIFILWFRFRKCIFLIFWFYYLLFNLGFFGDFFQTNGLLSHFIYLDVFARFSTKMIWHFYPIGKLKEKKSNFTFDVFTPK